MDKKGFDDIDHAFGDDAQNRKDQIRKDLEAERKEKHGFKYSDQDPDRQLAHYPHAHYKARDKAANNHEAAKKIKDHQLDAEVEQLFAQDRKTLEHAHFGELGRDHALQQALREEKLQKAKRRFRVNNNVYNDPKQKFLDDWHEEEDRANHAMMHDVSRNLLDDAKTKSTTAQSSSQENLIKAQRHVQAVEQDNTLGGVHLNGQFTKQNDGQRHKQRADKIIGSFKARRQVQDAQVQNDPAQEKTRTPLEPTTDFNRYGEAQDFAQDTSRHSKFQARAAFLARRAQDEIEKGIEQEDDGIEY